LVTPRKLLEFPVGILSVAFGGKLLAFGAELGGEFEVELGVEFELECVILGEFCGV